MLRRRMLLGSATLLGTVLTGAKSLADSVAFLGNPAAADAAKRLAGKILYKSDAEYEGTRQFNIFNARKPKRYPEAIVMAESVDDVVTAIKLAKAKGWRVGVRSGGHSWVAPHTRDKAIVINLSQMQEMSVDPVKRIATVSPSITGDVLNTMLQDDHKLMFPSAHGVGIGVGGFVMCGGHGWNARVWGPGCAQLRALDVINAEGELIHADETQNTDYLWAARGAGPGYFAAAVRYYLTVHPMPPVMKRSTYLYPIEALEALTGWVTDNAVGFPQILEVVMIGRQVDGVPKILLNGIAMGDSDAEVDAALDILDTCPAAGQAVKKAGKVPATAPPRFEQPTESMPAGYRFAVDNIWTSAKSSQLVPLMRELFTTFPTPKSYIFWQCWGPVHDMHGKAAYSVQGDIYIAANAVYEDEADDARCDEWVVSTIKRLDSISLGAQMNDEDMERHPARYLSAEAAERLEKLRAKYDPEHRFVSFLKRA